MDLLRPTVDRQPTIGNGKETEMGWFEDAVNSVGNALSDAADAIADVVEEVVEAVVEFVSDVVETVANVIEDVADEVADVVEKIPVVGETVARVIRQAGAIVSTPFRFLAAGIKAAGSIVSGLVAGSIRVLGGILAFDGSLIVEGFGDMASGIAGATLIVGAEVILTIQTALFFYVKRRLTQAERDLLKRVFWNSLALYNIRIVEGWAGIFSVNDRPFVVGNIIYMKNVDPAAQPEQLIHECVHPWQYQHYGARYSSDALAAQQLLPDAYSWEQDVQRGQTDWVDFNMEAQAEFMKDIYDIGALRVSGILTSEGDGVFFDADGRASVGSFEPNGINHTDRANAGVSALRGAINFRLSRFISN